MGSYRVTRTGVVGSYRVTRTGVVGSYRVTRTGVVDSKGFEDRCSRFLGLRGQV